MSARLAELLEDPRAPLLGLGAAILASACLVLYVTSGQSFAVDELFYYGRVATKDGGLVHFSGPSPLTTCWPPSTATWRSAGGWSTRPSSPRSAPSTGPSS